uniref:Uncharacterized protein n=1 Tax=Lotus japonicus TaxID=34305 RepID=I3SWY6_LOTJA|nr:unknown [Lotus japonicus]
MFNIDCSHLVGEKTPAISVNASPFVYFRGMKFVKLANGFFPRFSLSDMHLEHRKITD